MAHGNLLEWNKFLKTLAAHLTTDNVRTVRFLYKSIIPGNRYIGAYPFICVVWNFFYFVRLCVCLGKTRYTFLENKGVLQLFGSGNQYLIKAIK